MGQRTRPKPGLRLRLRLGPVSTPRVRVRVRPIHSARQVPSGGLKPGAAQEPIDARKEIQDGGVGEHGRAQGARAAVVGDVHEAGARCRVGNVRVCRRRWNVGGRWGGEREAGEHPGSVGYLELERRQSPGRVVGKRARAPVPPQRRRAEGRIKTLRYPPYLPSPSPLRSAKWCVSATGSRDGDPGVYARGDVKSQMIHRMSARLGVLGGKPGIVAVGAKSRSW